MIFKTKMFIILFFCVSLFKLVAQPHVIPNIRLTYGRDALFTQTLTTSDIYVDEPFYILIETSGTVERRGFHWRNLFNINAF